MFHYGMRGPDGSEMWGKFVYREIAPPERLVFIVSFSDENGGMTRHPMAPTWPLEMLNTLTFDGARRKDDAHASQQRVQRDGRRARHVQGRPQQHAGRIHRNVRPAGRLPGRRRSHERRSIDFTHRRRGFSASPGFLAGVMFACHGAQKLFGVFGGMPPGVPKALIWTAGPIEFFGGILIAIGLFTRSAAFLCSGLMAFAYFIGHAPQRLLADDERRRAGDPLLLALPLHRRARTGRVGGGQLLRKHRSPSA